MNDFNSPIGVRLLALPAWLAMMLALEFAIPAGASPQRLDARQSAAASTPDVDLPAMDNRPDDAKIDPSKLSNPTRLCGWWDNPTPGNAWMHDRSGEWTIAMQGMFEANGEWPRFKRGEQLPVGAPHGYGCACITARVDRASKFVYSFTDAQALPPQVCRRDPGLKGAGFQ
jgi:hypothetical protein